MTGQDNLETSTLLTRTDAFAAQVIARSTPIRFGVARSSAELQAIYRLRHRVVIEQDWAAPEAFPDELEQDAYDDRAVQIAAWDGDLLVGTTRLVLPAHGHPLPTEEAFGMKIEPADRVADVGRICRAPTYKDLHSRVVWGLLSRAWVEMRERGFTEICGTLSSSAARVYRSMGLRVVMLGVPRPHWGEKRRPMLIRPAESVDTFRWKGCSDASLP